MPIINEEFKDGIYKIILNKPEKKNALDTALMSALYQALQNAEKKETFVVVIRGAGNTFCAGGDLEEFREIVSSGRSMDKGVEILNKIVMLIRNINAIVVTVLEGVVVGAGISLALASDLSVAAQGTIMNLGYRRIGLTPDGGGSVFLPRIVGAKKFNEMYLLSRNITIDEAKDLGLINFVWEQKDLEEKVTKMIADLVSLPTEPVKDFKALVNNSLFSSLENHLEKEKNCLTEMGQRPGFKEKLDKFFGKK
jgi:2-(1,2-epoxy-1,2-dihydrophenyl)acetyl-CoA isomerase